MSRGCSTPSWVTRIAILAEARPQNAHRALPTDRFSAVQLTAYQAIYANGSTAAGLPPGIQFTIHSAPAPGPGGEASPDLPCDVTVTKDCAGFKPSGPCSLGLHPDEG